MAGFQLGCAIGLTLSPILMSQGGIFGPFVIFGLSGFLWVRNVKALDLERSLLGEKH